VWDVPVRVSHWLLASCVLAAWLTRDPRRADLHAAAGYCALGLVGFRFAWGWLGTRHARFSDFLYGPRAAAEYLAASLKGSPPHYTGHNPAGSWSVYLWLAGVLLTCVTGIIAIGAMFPMRPMVVALGAAAANLVRELHEWLAWALLAVIAVHVAGAIASSVLHRENLVGAMFTGRKRIHEGDPGDAPARRGIAVALFVAAVGGATAYLFASGWTTGYISARAQARAAKPAATPWTKECGGCHLAYPVATLPARSWDRMMREQAGHFGEDLSLSAATVKALLAEAHAGKPPTWAEWKLESSAPANEAPQRITELRYWRRAHRDLPDSAFKAPVSSGRHDCESCHVDAASGIFHPRMIQRPARESIL
jgi:cytochrome b